MTATTLGDFLCPEGYARPHLRALVREATVVPEAGRALARGLGDRRRRSPYPGRSSPRGSTPVLLVPGFCAGDASLTLLARGLRAQGWRTHRSGIHANVDCARRAVESLERRAETIAERRDSPVQLVGHSLGGMLARGLAARRPDLVAGLVTLGSPVRAPAAHHLLLTVGVGTLVGLHRAGVRRVMGPDCVRGDCARLAFELTGTPLPPSLSWTAVTSRRDGVVDWRACTHPSAHTVEVTASHLGMAVDPRVLDVVLEALDAARPAPYAVTA